MHMGKHTCMLRKKAMITETISMGMEKMDIIIQLRNRIIQNPMIRASLALVMMKRKVI